METTTVTYAWRGPLDSPELDRLHASAFGGAPSGRDWRAQIERHSLGWVCAREAGRLVGFVNVAWDGAAHAFLLDTAVAPDAQRRGIARRLVARAADGASAAGCHWLHVDFEPALRPFYFNACGFRSSEAGLIAL